MADVAAEDERMEAAALTQLGNVGPELGQGYIIDSFMVVVFGGVGRLAGAVAAALGLGILQRPRLDNPTSTILTTVEHGH